MWLVCCGLLFFGMIYFSHANFQDIDADLEFGIARWESFIFDREGWGPVEERIQVLEMKLEINRQKGIELSKFAPNEYPRELSNNAKLAKLLAATKWLGIWIAICVAIYAVAIVLRWVYEGFTKT